VGKESWKAMIEWKLNNGIDWLMGCELPSMVRKLGLGQPQAKTDVQKPPRPGSWGAVFADVFR
jgi:hypothetical protein